MMHRGREEWQIRTLHNSVFKNGIVWGDELSDLRDGPGISWGDSRETLQRLCNCGGEVFEKLDYELYKSKAKIGIF